MKFFHTLFAPKRYIKERTWLNWLVLAVWTLGVTYIMNFMMYFIQYGGRALAWDWHNRRPLCFYLSFILIFIVYTALESLGEVWISTLVVGAVAFIAPTINYFKLVMRGEPFFPWDLALSKELTAIMPQLEIKLTRQMIISLIFVIGAVLISLFIPFPSFKTKKYRNVIFRLAGFAVLAAACVVFVNKTYLNFSFTQGHKIYSDQWQQKSAYNNNGLICAFIMNTQFIKTEKPENYSEETMNKIADELVEKAKSTPEADQKPNIILIMSEGFWDVTELKNVHFKEELLPTLKYLQKNYMSGTIISPKFGGGTSNVEFETLTGFSNEFLPGGSTPYQQHVLVPFFSIADFLQERGYSSIAIHSSASTFWNRAVAYPNMGFQSFISEGYFKDYTVERTFVSDWDTMKKITEIYEKNRAESDRPLFNFTVTVQNHMPYAAEKYDPADIVEFTTDNISPNVVNGLQDLATGLHHSDAALQYLLDYFSKVDEPVIIGFFGDHRNQLGDTARQVFEENGLLSSDADFIEQMEAMYSTPFVIWSNMDMEKKDLGRLAPTQVMPILMNEFNIDMPVYFNYLLQTQDISRGFVMGYTVDSDSAIIGKKTPEQSELYEKLRLIQYDFMFGKRYTEDILFKTAVSEVK